MKIIIYICLVFSLLLSCSSHKEINQNSIDKSKVLKNQKRMTFLKCEQPFSCIDLFDCYNPFLKSDKVFDYITNNESSKYFNLDTLLSCCLYVYEKNIERKELADECLYNYYYQKYHDAERRNIMGIPTGVFHNHIFKMWNSKNSFKVSLLFIKGKQQFEKALWDGECLNQKFVFLENIIFDKINKIDGQDIFTYLAKNNVYVTPSDCNDSYVQAANKLIQKAWVEGKIELKDTQSNNHKK